MEHQLAHQWLALSTRAGLRLETGSYSTSHPTDDAKTVTREDAGFECCG